MSSSVAAKSELQDAVLRIWQGTFLYLSSDVDLDSSRSRSIEALLKPSDKVGCEDVCHSLYAIFRNDGEDVQSANLCLLDNILIQFYHTRPVIPQRLVSRVCDLLLRLPVTASKLPWSQRRPDQTGTPSGLIPANHSQSLTELDWDRLEVVTHTNVITIHFASLIILMEDAKKDTARTWASNLKDKFTTGRWLEAIINVIAELVDVTAKHREDSSNDDEKAWFLTEAYLWTSWQQAKTLFLWWKLDLDLFGSSCHDYFILDRLKPHNPTSLDSQHSRPCTELSRVPYMCTWAFELLRSNKSTKLLDFRRFHRRFEFHFKERSARCNRNTQEPCDGRSPYSCHRFVGMKIEDQSMHDGSFCEGATCRKLSWDEESYRRITGGQAVSLSEANEKHLRYVTVSQKTLAISHVWSHGQGGRPETGINLCLHLRYVSIARSIGCDSYWMNTPCIPEDHDLRREAILQINTVFMISKMTLICDQDLMSIDVSSLTMKIQELILVVILVCDWNLRAWTMLEAFKAYHNVHVLCKDNKLVSLSKILRNVDQKGAIDIAVSFLAAGHLIPRSHQAGSWLEFDEVSKSHETTDLERDAVSSLDADNSRIGTYRSFHIDKAGTFLSYRHASRPGDEIVIWSLLCSSDVFDGADALWKSFVGYAINTVFLISSAPRLQDCPGFSWAPSRPNSSPPADEAAQPHEEADYYTPMDMESEHAYVTSTGLRGKWFVWEFEAEGEMQTHNDIPLFANSRQQTQTEDRSSSPGLNASPQLQLISSRFIAPDYQWGALLQAVTQNPEYKTPIRYSGASPGRLVAVVASNDREEWLWKGVYAWKIDQEPLPQFALREIFIT